MAIYYSAVYGTPILIPPEAGLVLDGGDYEAALIGIIERSAINPTLPSGLRRIGAKTFSNYTNLALTSLPDGVTEIEENAFYACANLALTELPASLTTIGGLAFYDCTGLKTLLLPAALKTISMWAFRGCTGLESVTFNGRPTELSGTAFSGCENLTTINVPWAEGDVAYAPWGATNATINYNYKPTLDAPEIYLEEETG